MRIYLVGVSCVGKTAAGMLLAEKTGYEFVDFDEETKKEFGKPLLALHNQSSIRSCSRSTSRMRPRSSSCTCSMPS